MRILFCKIAWMNYYKGIIQGKDEPQNGGSKFKEKRVRTKNKIFMKEKMKMDKEIRMVCIS